MARYGIVHCDIEKNNILYDVDERGDINTYITDFGVAQMLLGAEKV